jgi:hypothetical protein
MRDRTPPDTLAVHLLPSALGSLAFAAVAVLAYLRVSRVRS